MLTIAEPEAGRVTVSGEPCIPQVFPPVRQADEIHVDGRRGRGGCGFDHNNVFAAAATGCARVSEIASSETSNGSTTNGTGFESTTGGPDSPPES